MLKILLLSDINSVHTQKWAKGLLDEGYTVHVFSLSSSTTNWHFNSDKLNYTCFFENNELTTQQTSFSKLKYLKAVNKIKSIISEFKPDIVHAHYATSYGLLGRLAKAKPFILSFWGSDVYEFPEKSFLHKSIFKWIIRYPDGLSSTSIKMSEELSKYTSRKIECIPFGIDCDFFKTSGKSKKQDELVIGTVKALEDVYGIDRLIKAYSYFQENYKGNTKLVIFGKGSKEIELKELVDKLDLNDKITFKGFVSGTDLIHAFESIDIFCALSRSESFGVAILEASAMELPVVVSDAGGLVEVVQNEVTGFIVPDGDPKLAAECFMKLSDKDNRTQFGKSGRKMVEEKFNFKTSIELLKDLYEKHITQK